MGVSAGARALAAAGQLLVMRADPRRNPLNGLRPGPRQCADSQDLATAFVPAGIGGTWAVDDRPDDGDAVITFTPSPSRKPDSTGRNTTTLGISEITVTSDISRPNPGSPPSRQGLPEVTVSDQGDRTQFQ